MTLTRIDARAALVVVDLQENILSAEYAHPTGPVVANAATLASAFRSAGLPVVVVTVEGVPPGRTDASRGAATPALATGAQPVAELRVQPSDLRVVKHSWGAFHDTDLDSVLRERDVTQVVVCGVSTAIGVETTARQAFERGYHVVPVTDAVTDRVAEAHEASLRWILPRLGECATTAEVVRRVGGASAR